ncbi:unnamed protein product [Amoebophrya sp. A25]|nr:unnamed protein product [Amoebophrya sp. A25]|eukprot:GSA25T00004017001.1
MDALLEQIVVFAGNPRLGAILSLPATLSPEERREAKKFVSSRFPDSLQASTYGVGDTRAIHVLRTNCAEAEKAALVQTTSASGTTSGTNSSRSVSAEELPALTVHTSPTVELRRMELATSKQKDAAAADGNPVAEQILGASLPSTPAMAGSNRRRGGRGPLLGGGGDMFDHSFAVSVKNTFLHISEVTAVTLGMSGMKTSGDVSATDNYFPVSASAPPRSRTAPTPVGVNKQGSGEFFSQWAPGSSSTSSLSPPPINASPILQHQNSRGSTSSSKGPGKNGTNPASNLNMSADVFMRKCAEERRRRLLNRAVSFSTSWSSSTGSNVPHLSGNGTISAPKALFLSKARGERDGHGKLQQSSSVFSSPAMLVAETGASVRLEKTAPPGLLREATRNILEEAYEAAGQEEDEEAEEAEDNKGQQKTAERSPKPSYQRAGSDAELAASLKHHIDEAQQQVAAGAGNDISTTFDHIRELEELLLRPPEWMTAKPLRNEFLIGQIVELQDVIEPYAGLQGVVCNIVYEPGGGLCYDVALNKPAGAVMRVEESRPMEAVGHVTANSLMGIPETNSGSSVEQDTKNNNAKTSHDLQQVVDGTSGMNSGNAGAITLPSLTMPPPPPGSSSLPPPLPPVMEELWNQEQVWPNLTIPQGNLRAVAEPFVPSNVMINEQSSHSVAPPGLEFEVPVVPYSATTGAGGGYEMNYGSYYDQQYEDALRSYNSSTGGAPYAYLPSPYQSGTGVVPPAPGFIYPSSSSSTTYPLSLNDALPPRGTEACLAQKYGDLERVWAVGGVLRVREEIRKRLRASRASSTGGTTTTSGNASGPPGGGVIISSRWSALFQDDKDYNSSYVSGSPSSGTMMRARTSGITGSSFTSPSATKQTYNYQNAVARSRSSSSVTYSNNTPGGAPPGVGGVYSAFSSSKNTVDGTNTTGAAGGGSSNAGGAPSSTEQGNAGLSTSNRTTRANLTSPQQLSSNYSPPPRSQSPRLGLGNRNSLLERGLGGSAKELAPPPPPIYLSSGGESTTVVTPPPPALGESH